MGFDKFGMVGHVPETKVADFVTFLEQGEVKGTRCKKCNTKYFPPRMDCAKCLVSDMEWVAIKGTGKLLTYSEVQYGPSGFEDLSPYTLAVADFDGLKVFGFLSRDIEEKDIKIGMSLKVVPLKLPPDRIAYELIKA
jgi:uncharacterized OB-fold protein